MAVVSEEYSDDYEEYYEDEEGEGPSGLLILVVGLLIVIVFCLIVVFAYKRGMADGASQAGSVPMVTADAGPVKTERELDLPASGNPEVDRTLSGESPAEVLYDAGAADDPLEDYEQTTSASEQASATPEPVAQQPVTRDPEPVTTQPAQQQPEPATQTTGQSAPVTATTPVRSQPQPAASTGTAAATSGSHVVQVGAFGSNQEANEFYNTLEGRYATLLSGKRPDIQRADLGSKGVFHRLRIGPFANYDAATNWCGRLKAAGQDCLVRAVD